MHSFGGLHTAGSSKIRDEVAEIYHAAAVPTVVTNLYCYSKYCTFLAPGGLTFAYPGH